MAQGGAGSEEELHLEREGKRQRKRFSSCSVPRACFIALVDLIPTDSRITTNQFPGGFMPLLVTFRNQVHFNVFVTMTTGSCNKKITVGFLIGSKYLEASKGK